MGSTTERSGHIPPFLTHKHSPTDYHLQMKINFRQGSLSGKTNCPTENEFNYIFEGKFLVSYHVRAFSFVFKFILFICNFSHLFLSLQILCQHIMAYSLVVFLNFLWDSWICEPVGSLHLYLFLVLFIGCLPTLFCLILMGWVLFYFYITLYKLYYLFYISLEDCFLKGDR